MNICFKARGSCPLTRQHEGSKTPHPEELCEAEPRRAGGRGNRCFEAHALREHLSMRELYLPPSHTHMPRDGGLVVAAVDDEIVALGLAGDGFIDGGVQEIIAF